MLVCPSETGIIAPTSGALVFEARRQEPKCGEIQLAYSLKAPPHGGAFLRALLQL